MKYTKVTNILLSLFAVVLCFGPVGLAAPVGTAFTYQGQMKDANATANGSYDFQFKLFDASASGNQLNSIVNKPGIDVIDGYFTVELDFGNVFDGNKRWLEIGVRPAGDPCSYTFLSPRQEIAPTPYALYALNVLWQVNDTNIYYNTGNVGIGTSTPDAKLTVENGTIKATNHLEASAAIYGKTTEVNSAGVYGLATAAEDSSGVHGLATGHGQGVNGESNSGDGVCGTSISGMGVDGTSISSNGVWGESGSGDGVHGKSTTGNAGYFEGKVQVNGNLNVTGQLTKGSGSFKIDHPLDPGNKFLQHSFVESPDMMNIYNGNVVLDKKGRASVTLPEWFQSLNKEFRYQLTCIGGFAPVYIAEKISGNHFKIAGGKPGMEVSWQVTGIRQDPYAVANRIVVEENKPVYACGYYLHPEVYGQSKDKNIENAPKPSLPEERQIARK
jgi:hypothetical protein